MEEVPAYFETGSLDYVDPTYLSGCTTHYYDALAREIRMDQPGLEGAFSRTEYRPLEKTVYDEEQTNPASIHAGCGMRYVEDGLQDKDGKGRLREVYELVKLTPSGEAGALTAWPTQYTYDLLDNFTGYTDSQGNQKFIEYDGLGRKTFMNDPDRGYMYYVYDAAGNLVQTTDAKGQVIRYAYDGVNRLLAEYYGADTAVPDVEYHYDADAGPVSLGEYWTPAPDQAVRQAILEAPANVSPDLDYNRDKQIDVADVVLAARAGKNKAEPTTTAANVKGYLAWVRDQSGEEHNSYDERGRVKWTIKRIQDTVPADLRNFYTGYAYDAMDRVTTLTYPDQTTVSYEYNGRGLLEAIPNVVTRVDYNPAGQNARLNYACGTSTTYDYDTRLRLSRLRTVRTRDNINLQDLNYAYDGVSNITAITDKRTENDYQTIGTELGISLDESKKFDNTQTFGYDSLYRLTQSSNITVYGTITHRYDPIGNMVQQDADLKPPDPLMNLGAMTSGGTGGTSGRIGRGPNDPPGPHAITGTKSTDGEMTFEYDANGNMTRDRDMEMRWDSKDRLKGITKGSTVAEYQYDYTDTRKKKAVEGEADKTVFYVDKYSEVRENKIIKYIILGNNKVAKITDDQYFNLFYIHNHLGSISIEVFTNAVVGKQCVQQSYGLVRKEISSTKIKGSIFFRFLGKEQDLESSLYYFEARYLSPFSNKFSSVDPEICISPENYCNTPQAQNSYCYALNRPQVCRDPEGDVGIFGAVLGGAIQVVQDVGKNMNFSNVTSVSSCLSEVKSAFLSTYINKDGSVNFGNIAKVGVAAGTGFLGAGMASKGIEMLKLGNSPAGRAFIAGASASLSSGLNRAGQNRIEGKSWSDNIVRDMAISGIAGGGLQVLGEGVKKGTQTFLMGRGGEIKGAGGVLGIKSYTTPTGNDVSKATTFGTGVERISDTSVQGAQAAKDIYDNKNP